jgi:N-acetylglucosamine-6-sulfatase
MGGASPTQAAGPWHHAVLTGPDGRPVAPRVEVDVSLTALLLLLVGVIAASPLPGISLSAVTTESVATRPDIVIIYLDDVDPHDGRLWSDPHRTPALAGLFSERGISLTNAVAETPLCSPGRAGFLTGQHTSNHRVDGNVARPFDPTVTLGSELQQSGYRTLFVGKYLNGLRTDVPRRRMLEHAAGWHEFDVMWEDNGKYLGYDMWTRDGMTRYGKRNADHSTLVTKRRLVDHLRASSADEPVLAVASVFDLHAPNRPVKRNRGDPRCRSIDAWKPPSFSADVSDKPDYVRRRRPIGKDGWPMRRYCEEMLAVDELAAAVVRVQRQRGRLADTLFVLTADNGVTWGTQRLQQRKGVPYATPVPLVFSWPARWGDTPRKIDELVSNIDLAPTLCAVGGCTMGPYPNGQQGPDGLDLLPLLDGASDHLDRILVREQSGPHYRWAPQFWAIRTSAQHPLGRWHYIEYETGESELYDLATDPWQLVNLAHSPTHATRVDRLAIELRDEFGEGEILTTG